MYLNQQEIQSLVQYRNAEHPVVSLYLNVTPPRKFDTEFNSLIHVAKTKLIPFHVLKGVPALQRPDGEGLGHRRGDG
jgi:hypothetical protein